MSLPGESDLRIVGGATHLFGEPGALGEVCVLAADWFARHLRTPEWQLPWAMTGRHIRELLTSPRG